MRSLALCCAVAGLSSAALAADYVEVASHEDLFGAGSTMFTRSVVTDGASTLYVFGADNNPLGFEVIKYDTTTSTATKLADLTSFVSDIPSFSPDDPFPGYGFGYVAATNELQLIDGASSAIYRFDASTGDAYEYLSNAAIAAHTGLASADLVNYSGTTVDGEAVFFEDDSKSILISSSAGSVSTLVSATELVDATGGNDVRTGLTSDGQGNYYWGQNSTDVIYKYDGNTVSPFIAIGAVGGDSFSGDMFYAPDGLIYVRMRTGGANALWSFDPAAVDPTASLTQILSGSQLADGPLGSNFISEISWFEGQPGFHRISTSLGYYAVPAPSTFALAAILGMAGLTRRR
ncbi:PEP-CTERM sorting domain-containing protein [Mucisphaera calidilacus]|uniref:Uncharacterized protein n=1 Tax=Mucisphaera calidilacus TaxID=2527982 RepID=A0A518BU61_9BACT|nr:PEP-CTERM sorting domain-containing protein [Mucisphaera calidilacus]QDU70501.1 hypothetical protein Pan265_03290 [Mucisphaera calidilacus]